MSVISDVNMLIKIYVKLNAVIIQMRSTSIAK